MISLDDLNIFTYDIEVFKYDWFVGFKEKRTGERTRIHNNLDAVMAFVDDTKLLVGYNNKHYDNFILKAILAGADHSLIKEINDFIISGYNGWEHPFISSTWGNYFHSFDVMDDVQIGTSLKSIQAHLGLPVRESNVDFNIDRPLTQEEIQLTLRYNDDDIDTAEKLIDIRRDYLEAKIMLGSMRDINPQASLYCTNAKIVAKYLGAKKVERADGRNYIYPENLDLSVIPKGIIEFFNTIHDKKIPDKTLFKTSYDIDLGGCLTRYAWGGVHGSLLSYSEAETDNRVIQIRDVTSLYPNLMIKYEYLSRNVPSADVFVETLEQRQAAKRTGDERTSKALKLPLNTTSGAQENQYNELYDPRNTRSMRISGQLFLTELVVRLIDACPSFKLINFNTDGLLYSVDKSELHLVDSISDKWEKSTGFELKTDDITKVWVKDVNNLLIMYKNGKKTWAGSYLTYGIQEKGAWSINNNFTIVKDAVINYFTNDQPIEKTINDCNDIFKFQIIAKAGGNFKEVFHKVNGEKVITQRCNRVYPVKDTRYGTLYKVHSQRGNDNKIAGLPERCKIDNENEMTIDEIDKSWYIRLAQKYVNDYLGIKPPKRNTRKLNSLKKQIIKILEDN